jgi:hypothetical protein
VIKHIVIWKLKDTAEGQDKWSNARALKQKLEALNGQIPGVIKIEVGIDFSRTESSGDVVLYGEFKSRQALNTYQDHPEHEAVKAFVTGIREERRIVDYEA